MLPVVIQMTSAGQELVYQSIKEHNSVLMVDVGNWI